ncbi:MAG: hypothetical protein HN580_18610 [Deltaproteobacteria bacterium]|nr:hypothetical protein [Deltaproteobacteria bacterium]MBT6613530.1 hypothetical protein [Deltaproteobacteria bacterium]MBT7154780.1 hypothetical protein [Deltaproteobacteria bacterium]MBT7714216.1 hypothetical protein [Deltaproteobacteria bacterium]MBT7891037.1 hypothetical protein [Deltaproteobacteria bacterium]
MSDSPYFKASPLRYLDDQQMQQLHQATLELMRDIGCSVQHDQATGQRAVFELQ